MACGVLLLTAVFLQRTTIVAAAGRVALDAAVGRGGPRRGRPGRARRARRHLPMLLGSPRYGDAALVHETGSAASKGLPMGGAVGTALRWSVARDRSIPTSTFAVALIATSVASVFVTWTLPLVALGIDLTQRSPESMDFVVVGICSTVVIGGDRGLDGRARIRSDPRLGRRSVSSRVRPPRPALPWCRPCRSRNGDRRCPHGSSFGRRRGRGVSSGARSSPNCAVPRSCSSPSAASVSVGNSATSSSCGCISSSRCSARSSPRPAASA